MNKMKPKSVARRTLNGPTLVAGFLTATATAALLLASTTVYAAGGGGNPGSSGDHVRFEAISGTKLKRVILTSRAVERLGIEHAKISTKTIMRKQMVGGSVTHPLKIQAERRMAKNTFGGFALASASSNPKMASIDIASLAAGAWVRVVLSEEEWNRVDHAASARILPLATRPDLPKEAYAAPSRMPPIRDVKRTMMSVYYVVPGKDHGMRANDRMRVELTLKGNNKTHTVMPYSALYYDGKGKPWVYITTKPGTYERRRVEIDRIIGDVVVLKKGPPVGTSVVSVGATFLYGAEVIFKK